MDADPMTRTEVTYLFIVVGMIVLFAGVALLNGATP